MTGKCQHQELMIFYGNSKNQCTSNKLNNNVHTAAMLNNSSNFIKSKVSYFYNNQDLRGKNFDLDQFSTNNKDNLTIYLQNIRGRNNKTEELLLSFSSDFPHILCLTEHNLNKMN
jgi:Tol biopolymer transport system component